MLVNLLGDYLTENDYLQLGKVSKSFYKAVEPIMIMKKCNAESIYPDLKITGEITERCSLALKKIRRRVTLSDRDPDFSPIFKSVQISDWRQPIWLIF